MFHTYVTHNIKNYKVVNDRDSYVNIISKSATEKMDLNVKPHP